MVAQSTKMAIGNKKPIGQRTYSWKWATNWPFRRSLLLYDTKWQDALDVKHNLFQNIGVILMLLPGKAWFFVATFNNQELQHDLARGREGGELTDRQTERLMVAWETERWHEDKRGETRELKKVRNISWNPNMPEEMPSLSLLLPLSDKYTQTWTCAGT